MSARGEAVIQLDDREIAILYTNKALAAAERQMGKSILGVVNGFGNPNGEGASGINELAHLLQAGMEAARRDARLGGRSVTLNDAYDVLDELGFADAATEVMQAVAEVISYSRNGAAPEKNGQGVGLTGESG